MSLRHIHIGPEKAFWIFAGCAIGVILFAAIWIGTI
jgi:hypothetical protein